MRTRTGETVELRNLVRIEKGAAPSAITRVNQQRAVRISANLEGKDAARALEDATEIAAELLPEDVQMLPAGGTEEMVRGFTALVFAMGLGILVIYMVLAAQFESLVHPLTVMLALPLAMVGAFGGLFLMGALGRPGMTLNLFSLIGIILLFGLVTKNSILLVDYANQLRDAGMDKVEAMRTAAPVRMRPGADDGDLDDLRRAARGARHRARRRDARADGGGRGAGMISSTRSRCSWCRSSTWPSTTSRRG